jgi:mRNA-degrading endonuclease RelE of RelBE toxin-antitoxin system
MKVIYSKSFQKAYRKQPGKLQKSIADAVREVKEAASVESLTDCIKLTGFKHAYRLRIGYLRAFFILRIEGNTAAFEYLVPRGEAYSKKMMDRLKNKD